MTPAAETGFGIAGDAVATPDTASAGSDVQKPRQEQEMLLDSLRGVRIGMNAVPLIGPLTGVGQYTYRLVTEMQKVLPVPPWLFYGTGWGQELRSAAPAGARSVHNAIKRFAPKPEVVSRFLKQTRFAAGVRRHAIELYHEPAYLAFPFRGPTIVTVHDISWIRHPETHPVERVREMNRVLPKVIERATHIVVDSEFVRQEVMEYYGVASDRVTTVLLGTSPEFVPLDANATQAVLRQHGLEHGSYLLAVGTLEPRKNLSTVITAYGRLPAALRECCPLVIVGMNGWKMDRFSDGLRDMIAKGEVRLPGYVHQRDLPALYSGARAFVYPSLYEGFGLPPLEAMACGVPVIASRRASLPEVVGDAGILVEPMDDTSITHHMRALIEDNALHAAMSEAGIVRAAGFTWQKFAREMVAIYARAVA